MFIAACREEERLLSARSSSKFYLSRCRSPLLVGSLAGGKERGGTSEPTARVRASVHDADCRRPRFGTGKSCGGGEERGSAAPIRAPPWRRVPARRWRKGRRAAAAGQWIRARRAAGVGGSGGRLMSTTRSSAGSRRWTMRRRRALVSKMICGLISTACRLGTANAWLFEVFTSFFSVYFFGLFSFFFR